MFNTYVESFQWAVNCVFPWSRVARYARSAHGECSRMCDIQHLQKHSLTSTQVPTISFHAELPSRKVTTAVKPITSPISIIPHIIVTQVKSNFKALRKQKKRSSTKQLQQEARKSPPWGPHDKSMVHINATIILKMES